MTADPHERLRADWVSEARDSYDRVARPYSDLVRNFLDDSTYDRALFGLFAELAGERATIADVGCGPGNFTAYLAARGLDAYGIDLSPAMVELARREHPGVRFEVGSMLAIDAGDRVLGGIVAWYSTIHVPDDDLPRVFAEFKRVLRPGAPVLLGFHAGDGAAHKTEGYGGHPMNVMVYRRTPDFVARCLEKSGFVVEAETLSKRTHGSVVALS